MRDIIKSIKLNDPALKSTFEVLLYPGFWAMLSYKMSNPLYKIKLYFLARLISQISRLMTNIEIHPGATIGKGLFIDHGAGIVIGETCEIGNNVLLYQGVTLGGTGKDIGKRHPTIGDNVMIGAGAKVLGPFKVGNNVLIGAGSVVLKEVPDNATVVGVPGRAVVTKDNIVRTTKLNHSCCINDPMQVDIDLLMHKITELEEKVERLENEKKQ